MPAPAAFDLPRLLRDVFDPRPGERVLVMVDEPHGRWTDDADWADRRAFAAEWREAFAALGLAVQPLLAYPATGAGNADLPAEGRQDGQTVRLADALAGADIAVAMTRFSATAPLVAFTRRLPNLRAASLPNVLRRMTGSALAADYTVVAKKCAVLADLLEDAVSAEVEFDTGHRVTFDLRHRAAHADDGQCRRGRDHRVINLPSGEAFIVPYEGERPGDPSRTAGEIPVRQGPETAVLRIRANRIEEVAGEGRLADRLRELFALDPARRNVAELGLGCNDRAIVTGNVLEDEKAGFHWAYGRSEHLGGTVGPDAFSRPEHVLHHDIVYARGCPIEVRRLDLVYPDREHETILRDGDYVIF